MSAEVSVCFCSGDVRRAGGVAPHLSLQTFPFSGFRAPPGLLFWSMALLGLGAHLTLISLLSPDCAKACLGCMGAGPGRCKKCSPGYQQVGSKCLGESPADGTQAPGSASPSMNGEGAGIWGRKGGMLPVQGQRVVLRDGQDGVGVLGGGP